MTEKRAIAADELLTIANNLIHEHENYMDGMHTNAVDEKLGVLVFKGEYFLDEHGLPTTKTTSVFNMFKYLAQQLSKQYTLK